MNILSILSKVPWGLVIDKSPNVLERGKAILGKLKNGFQLNYTRSRREDFTDNTVYEVSDSRRSALVCLAWHENIADGTLKKLRDLAEADERPFFICLERDLTTIAKWNLKHFLGNHFTAF